jgi:hypothetical protein
MMNCTRLMAALLDPPAGERFLMADREPAARVRELFAARVTQAPASR